MGLIPGYRGSMIKHKTIGTPQSTLRQPLVSVHADSSTNIFVSAGVKKGADSIFFLAQFLFFFYFDKDVILLLVGLLSTRPTLSSFFYM